MAIVKVEKSVKGDTTCIKVTPQKAESEVLEQATTAESKELFVQTLNEISGSTDQSYLTTL